MRKFDLKALERLLVEGFIVVSLLITLGKIVRWEWRDWRRSFSHEEDCAVIRALASEATPWHKLTGRERQWLASAAKHPVVESSGRRWRQ